MMRQKPMSRLGVHYASDAIAWSCMSLSWLAARTKGAFPFILSVGTEVQPRSD